MAIEFKIRKNVYYDSLRLMRISKTASEAEGIKSAFAVMATDKAKYALNSSGLLNPEIEKIKGSDLVIIVEAESKELARQTIDRIETLLLSDDSLAPPQAPNILDEQPRVVNVGLEIFGESLVAQGIEVRHVEWKVPAKGNKKLVNLLKKMV
ncbi:MAG: hypothetical protein OXF23_07200 [Candidatus Dadabacteria bacterium]|nr:hypothetical protein [Candidatus Dadabacteria bacterium]MCY4262528.1 hypothetical protein [Candidatus Dadabacteria bacterium]